MGRIQVNNIRVYSFHGCLEEESIIGSDYRVDLEVEADVSLSAKTDNLTDTVDYVHLYKIVATEMAIPSKLLEHVAERILEKIFADLVMVSWALVKVTKINPPIGGDVESVAVVLEKKR